MALRSFAGEAPRRGATIATAGIGDDDEAPNVVQTKAKSEEQVGQPILTMPVACL